MRISRAISSLLLAVVIVVSASVLVYADQGNASTVNIELKNVPIRQAIDKLFEGTGLKYYIQPGVTGKVAELKMKGVTFDQALGALTSAAELTYTIVDGAYIIGPATPAQAGAGPTVPRATPNQMQATPPLAESAPPVQRPGPPPAPPVVVNNQVSPVVNAGGGGDGYAPYGGYGYSPFYRFGNVGVIGGWGGPVAVAGGSPYIVQYGPPPPPPEGYVSPDWLKFLRWQYAMQPRPFITYGY